MPAAFNEEVGESNLSRLASTCSADTTRDVIAHTNANWVLLKDQGNYNTEPVREFKGKGRSGRFINADDADLEETTVFLRQRFRALGKDQFTTYSGPVKEWTSKMVAEATLRFQAPASKWKVLRSTDAFKTILKKAVTDVNGTWIQQRDLTNLIKGIIPVQIRPEEDDLAGDQVESDAEPEMLAEVENEVEVVQEDAVSEPEHFSEDEEKRPGRRVRARPQPGDPPLSEPPLQTEEDAHPYDRPRGPRPRQRSTDPARTEDTSDQRARPATSRARPTVHITDHQGSLPPPSGLQLRVDPSGEDIDEDEPRMDHKHSAPAQKLRTQAAKAKKPTKKSQAGGQVRVKPAAPSSSAPERERPHRAGAFRPTGYFYDIGASGIEESTNPDEALRLRKVNKKAKRRD